MQSVMKALCLLSCLSVLVTPLASGDEPLQVDVLDLEQAQPKPKTEAIPKEHAGHKEIAIILEDLKRADTGLYFQLTFRVINPTSEAMHFTGYSEQSPLTKTQRWVDGEWVGKREVLRCGTGLRQCTVAPGQSAVFQTGVQGDLLPVRIGIGYSHGKNKKLKLVWSEKIER